MAKIFNRIRETATTSSGSADINFTTAVGGLGKQILVFPTTDNTVYDITLLDKHSDPILERELVQGNLNLFIDLPIVGLHTLQIRNSSADEVFTFKLVIEEIS